MDNLYPLKMFGKGQVTLPKFWREQASTNNFVAEVTPQGLLIKPLTSTTYYEIDDQNFGLNFPTGIAASKLVDDLKEANAELS